MASPQLPTVYQVVSAFKAQLLREEQDAQRRMVTAWRRVETELEDSVESLAFRLDEMAKGGINVDNQRAVNLASRQGLLRKAKAEIDEYVDRVAEPEVFERQDRAIRTGVQQAQSAIDAAGDGIISARSFDRLPVEEVRGLVGLAGDGSPLRATLLNQYAYSGVDGIMAELVTGVGVGRGPREMARRAVRNGLSRSLNHMLVVMRTETLRSYRAASMEQYKHSGLVEGYKRLATKDSRVCLGCLLRDGEFYELGEIMPEHPNGRCAMVPVLIGGQAATWQSGADWLIQQDEPTQISIMGSQRHAAWRDGQFELEEAVKVTPNETWGASIGPKPLKDLVE